TRDRTLHCREISILARPIGWLERKTDRRLHSNVHAPVAQLDRAAGFGTVGRGVQFLRARHTPRRRLSGVRHHALSKFPIGAAIYGVTYTSERRTLPASSNVARCNFS